VNASEVYCEPWSLSRPASGFALLLELAHLPTEPAQLVALLRRQPVLALELILLEPDP